MVEEVFAGTSEVLVDNPVLAQSDADGFAEGWFNEMALRYVEGDGVCIGRTDLRAGILVDIEGLGRRFSGRYYLTSVKHIYQPNLGYRTSFSARRNAT
jgi:phage protein D